MNNSQKQIKRAQIINYILYIVSFVLFVTQMAHPIIMILLLAIPFLLPILLYFNSDFSKGWFKIAAQKNQYPDLSFLLLTLICMLFVEYLWWVIDVSKIVIPLLVTACIPTVILFLALKKEKTDKGKIKDIGNLIVIFLFFCAHAYSTLVFYNAYLGHQESKMFTVQVISKEVSGRFLRHYLELDTSANPQPPSSIGVSSDTYEKIQTGDKLYLYQFQGYFTPWYRIDKSKIFN